jgi:hypothetical protein
MRFAWVHESICRDRRISNAQFRTLVCLISHADKSGYCYPSVGVLAHELSRTRSTVRHHLNGLVELGVITRDPMPRKDGSRGANRYCVAQLRYIEPEPAPAYEPAAEEAPPSRVIQPALLLPLNGGRRTAARPDNRKTPPPARRARRADLIAATGLAQINGWAR